MGTEPPRHRYPQERQISCSMTSVLLRTVRGLKGEPGVQVLLERSQTAHRAAFLEDADNWISLEEGVALLEAGIGVTGDPQLPERVGRDAVRQHAGTQVATLLRSLGSPEAVMSAIATTAAKFSVVTELEALEAQPGHAVVRAVARPGHPREPLHCDWTRGILSTPTMLFGLPAATVKETECQARGGCECRYVITWDAGDAATAIDPQEHITALEAQVVALTQRLENVFATASDLVSPDDIDTVLTRIISRAAGAVRAPGYVLVVQPHPHAPPRIFSDGVSPEEAERIATGSVETRCAASTRLSVPVASSRRDYGRLVAVQPPGMEFFPQERQILMLYARHAAAVLDTALALDEARRRERHLQALLRLAETLARAGGTDEVAVRLAESVKDVVDCDRASVWVWDPRTEKLRRGAAYPPIAQAARGDIGLEETPYVERLLESSEPLFLTGTEDEVIGSLLRVTRSVALVVVPIVGHEGMVGVVTVSAGTRPERLASSADLIDRLTGIAVLAAPALQNGRLIDELDRQVIHDELTGILNRTGFLRSVEHVLERPDERTGMLFVDLNGFKRLNDENGHHFGDTLLRQVAQRLRSLFREEDAVARFGGDEFAVILPQVSGRAELERAALRVQRAFEEPFSLDGHLVHLTASVGHALSPAQGATVDDLVRRADSAMYREKERAYASGVLSV